MKAREQMPSVQPSPSSRAVKVGWIDFSPVHYKPPLYRMVSNDHRIDLTVIFLSRDGLIPHEGGYGQPVTWDVDLLSGYPSEFAKRSLKNRGHINHGLLHYRDLDVVGSVAAGRFEVLILHGYNSLTHQLAAIAQLLRGRPVIFREEQNLLAPRPRWKTMVKNSALPPIFRRCYALCIGTENARWFERFGVPDNHRYLAPWAVDNDRLQFEASVYARDRDRARAAFGLPEGCPVVLFAGRLAPHKDPLILLRAFAEVRAKLPCALLYVGSGPLLPDLQAEAERLGLQDVHFAGFVEQSRIPCAYAVADLLVLPSVHECWGTVVGEAMACGVAVIVSDRVGSASDLVRHGANGYVVPSGDVEALAEAIGSLVSCPERAREFGDTSTAIMRDWTHERAAKGVLAAISDAVGPARWAAANQSW